MDAHQQQIKDTMALVAELRTIATAEGRLPGSVARRRDAIISRLKVQGEVDLAVEASGLSRVRVLNIARVTEPAALLAASGSTIATADGTVIAETRKVDATKPRAKKGSGLPAFDAAVGDLFTGPKSKRAPKAKAAPADSAPRRRGFDPAPPGGHVPPRARKIRSTGSVIEFGHMTDMGVVEAGAGEWVSRCLTHEVASTFKTRGEARYQDGTMYCIECAALAN